MSEFDAIWDAVAKASEHVCRMDEIRRKREQLRNVLSKTCGNCEKWMKTSCVPEKQYGQFKCVNSPACDLFQLSWSSERMAAEFQGELDEMTEVVG